MGLWEVLVALGHDHEPLALRHWKRTKKERIGDAEHSRGAPDAD